SVVVRTPPGISSTVRWISVWWLKRSMYMDMSADVALPIMPPPLIVPPAVGEGLPLPLGTLRREQPSALTSPPSPATPITRSIRRRVTEPPLGAHSDHIYYAFIVTCCAGQPPMAAMCKESTLWLVWPT